MDLNSALRFLDSSASRLIALARSWMDTREEPIDLLFVLSREVGQALGPWETFRLCALLGLTPAHAVRELGLDVLAEPVTATCPHLPPVSEAFAVAQARAAWPTEAAPYADPIFQRLCADEATAEGSYAIAAGALVAALAVCGISDCDEPASPFRVPVLLWQPDDPRVAQTLPLLRYRLEQGPLEKGVPELAELSRLCPPAIPSDLRHAFHAAVDNAQQDDGGFGPSRTSRRVREWTTLRMVLALHPLREPADPSSRP